MCFPYFLILVKVFHLKTDTRKTKILEYIPIVKKSNLLLGKYATIDRVFK